MLEGQFLIKQHYARSILVVILKRGIFFIFLLSEIPLFHPGKSSISCLVLSWGRKNEEFLLSPCFPWTNKTTYYAPCHKLWRGSSGVRAQAVTWEPVLISTVLSCPPRQSLLSWCWSAPSQFCLTVFHAGMTNRANNGSVPGAVWIHW